MSQPWSDDRYAYVARMFDVIAERYDVMNWVMTLGQDQRWRRQAAHATDLSEGDIALDVATGTGDLALELAEQVGRSGQVLGIDIVLAMLEQARRKIASRVLPVSFEPGDAHALNYPDDSFDATVCGFGLRNMDNRQHALTEMARVTRPGKRVVILELTPPNNALARGYMDQVIPRLGQVLAGAREAYTYLPESVQDFPDAPTLGRMMQAAGLRTVHYRILNFGTVALHWGTKSRA